MNLIDIIKESLPNNRWVELSDEELAKFKEDIYNMIEKSYKPIGGYPGINSPDDINTDWIDIWRAIDVDNDNDPDVVSMEKEKPPGRKFVGGATSGKRTAKRTYIKSRIDLLKKPGYYVEASHKIADILASSGVPVVKDPEKIRKVVDKPDIRMVDAENGFYERSIGGRKIVKRLFGKPK